MSRYSHLIDEMNYHNDPRVSARKRGKWYDDFDARSMRCLVTTYDYGEDFDRDPDFEEDYFRGVHDVGCYECDGQRVVPVPVESCLSPEQQKLLTGLREQEEEDRQHAAEVAAERRYGC